jgi:hypothetical protein
MMDITEKYDMKKMWKTLREEYPDLPPAEHIKDGSWSVSSPPFMMEFEVRRFDITREAFNRAVEAGKR